MATTKDTYASDPHPASQPAVPKSAPPPSIGNTGGHSEEDMKRLKSEREAKIKDAPPFIDEQRARSHEIETMGTSAWVHAHDERPEEDKPELVEGALPIGSTLNTKVAGKKQVPGVSTPVKDDGTGNKKLAP